MSISGTMLVSFIDQIKVTGQSTGGRLHCPNSTEAAVKYVLL